MMSTASIPSLKNAAHVVEDNGTFMQNAIGDELMDDVKTITLHLEPEIDKETPIERKDRAKALRFGSDPLPWNDFFNEALQQSSRTPGKRLEVLGFLERNKVTVDVTIGPPRLVSGASSLRACSLVSALAHSLDQRKSVAISTYKYNATSNTLLCALFPAAFDAAQKNHRHLILLQLPYAGECERFNLGSFDNYLDDKLRVTDDLVDSMMMPDEIGANGKSPSPILRSINQTLVKRALDSESKLFPPRTSRPNVPSNVVISQSKKALEKFACEFPLNDNSNDKDAKRKKKGKKVYHYSDYL